MSSILLCIYHMFFICSSVDRHLGCFCILEIINDVAVSIEVHVSFPISVFGSFGSITMNGVAG